MVRVPPPQPLEQNRNSRSGFLLYNLRMIHIFAAIECEISPLRHMVSDELEIVLTGIGKVNAAFAVGRTFPDGLTRKDLKDDVIINIGICGSKDLSGLFLVNKITDEATSKDYYPDMIRVTGLPEAPLITCDHVAADLSSGVLYDMEGSAIFQTAAKLISPDRIIFLKLVSDKGTDAGDVTAEWVKETVSSYLPEITSCIEQIKESLGTHSEKHDYTDLYSKLHASSSMELKIGELMEFAQSMGIDGRKLFDEAGAEDAVSRAQGKEVILRVKDKLISC